MRQTGRLAVLKFVGWPAIFVARGLDAWERAGGTPAFCELKKALRIDVDGEENAAGQFQWIQPRSQIGLDIHRAVGVDC